MTFQYLISEEVIEINKLVTRLTGGAHGLREQELLESLVLKPQTMFSGDELYPDIHLKAAVLFEAITNYHVFVDGNKRTAFASMAALLNKNNLTLITTDKEIVKLCLATANKANDLSEIATWVKTYSKKY